MSQPHAVRWAFKRTQTLNAEACGVELRESLDNFTSDWVIWNSYHGDILPPQNLFYAGCLFACEVREPYQPQRVLRQFGHVQSIPFMLYQPIVNTLRGIEARGYIVEYSASEYTWNQWMNAQLAPELCGQVVINDCTYTDLYALRYIIE